mmetsp:Transcript_16838/g.43563  ORF Transcript_16838/g.43563 Transcript_16838/m.43563 type:complete len:212 (-) Transcript_16838:558-1193(-)
MSLGALCANFRRRIRTVGRTTTWPMAGRTRLLARARTVAGVRARTRCRASLHSSGTHSSAHFPWCGHCSGAWCEPFRRRSASPAWCGVCASARRRSCAQQLARWRRSLVLPTSWRQTTAAAGKHGPGRLRPSRTRRPQPRRHRSHAGRIRGAHRARSETRRGVAQKHTHRPLRRAHHRLQRRSLATTRQLRRGASSSCGTTRVLRTVTRTW